MSIAALVTMSRKYGSNPEYVLAGGGNTSFKDTHFIYVKASGNALATIDEDGFVKLERAKLDKIFENRYSEDFDEREKEVLADMLAARCPGEEHKRPSVEALLHHILPYSLVLHLHPTVVGGLVCSEKGKEFFDNNFSDDGIWIEPTMPGYILSVKVNEALEAFKAAHNKLPLYIFLENHGVFTGGTTLLEIEYRMSRLYEKLESNITSKPDYPSANTTLRRLPFSLPL
jgi:rhamnose utilization protein RhaD (predicted bifunctional aldolase and dehydrogenase)